METEHVLLTGLLHLVIVIIKIMWFKCGVTGCVMGYRYDAFGETGMALRPVVSLNSEITVNATDAE